MSILIIHPVFQLTVTVLGLYVLKLGVDRIRRLHLRQKIVFRWQRHVWLGSITLVCWLLGMFSGLITVKMYWHGIFITGTHGKRAYIILPLIVFGIISGWYMNKQKKQRLILPIIHGSNNILLVIMVLLQAVSGWQVYNIFVLGN